MKEEITKEKENIENWIIIKIQHIKICDIELKQCKEIFIALHAYIKNKGALK